LPCLIVRNKLGALCGYVGVTSSHPCFEKDYDDVRSEEAHGGLTFSGFCNDHICHEVEPGEDAHVWWLGFDCAHAGDFVPGIESLPPWRRIFTDGDVGDDNVSKYRDLAYVEGVVTKLAQELARLT
jgi:hypothetical protein